MTPHRLVIIVLLGVGIVTAGIGYEQWTKRQKLAARLTALEQADRDRAQLLVRLKRVRDQISDEHSRPIPARAAIPPPAAAAPPDRNALAAGFTDRDALKFRGTDTPEHALESFWWALDRGDVPALTKLLKISDSDRAKFDQFYAGLPESVHQQYPDVTTLFATLYSGITHLYFIGEKIEPAALADSGESATVTTAYEYPGGFIREHPAEKRLVQTPDGWQMVMSASDVIGAIGSARPPPRVGP